MRLWMLSESIPGGFLLSITMAAIAYLGVGFLAPGTAAASAE